MKTLSSLKQEFYGPQGNLPRRATTERMAYQERYERLGRYSVGLRDLARGMDATPFADHLETLAEVIGLVSEAETPTWRDNALLNRCMDLVDTLPELGHYIGEEGGGLEDQA